MKHIVLITSILLTAPISVQAEEGGLGLMERGAKLFMQGILEEMEPALKELEGLKDDLEPALRGFAKEMGPALRDLLEQVEDWSAYHAPEILPNGDIILRKKRAGDMPPDREIDL